jgi:hypothetical protein
MKLKTWFVRASCANARAHLRDANVMADDVTLQLTLLDAALDARVAAAGAPDAN